MRRVVTLGPGASGKSTLAIHLGEITGLRVIERADFWLWLLRYRRQSRPFLMEAIAKYAGATPHVIRNPEALRRFVADVQRNREAG